MARTDLQGQPRSIILVSSEGQYSMLVINSNSGHSWHRLATIHLLHTDDRQTDYLVPQNGCNASKIKTKETKLVQDVM